MAWTLINSNAVGFADGGSGGHVYTLPSGAPAVGDLDILAVNSDTVVSTPSGFSVATTFVNSQGSYLYYRIATGGEAGTVTVSTSGNFDTSLIWLRWQGAAALDVGANAHVDAADDVTTPAVSTGTLGSANDLVVVFAALHTPSAGTPTGVTWSSGYTAATQGAQVAVAGLVGYKTGAGTGSESPSVSWTNKYFDRYILVGTFTPSAAGPVSGSASLGGAGAVSASATVRVPASASSSGAGSLSATASVRVPSAAALSGAGAVSSASSTTVPGTAALTGIGSTAGVGTARAPGAANLAGSGSLTASASTLVAGTAALTGAGSLAANTQSTITGSATFAGAGAVAAAGLPGRLGTAALAGAGTLTAVATVRIVGSASLTGVAALAGSGSLRVPGTAALVGAGSLTAAVSGQVVQRPYAGTVTRPDSGYVVRPNTGTVTRP